MCGGRAERRAVGARRVAAGARARDAERSQLRARWWQWSLALVYVLGCGFRSFFPRADVQRIALVDSWLSTVVVGRWVATVAESCFAAQWALLIREYARDSGTRGAWYAALQLGPADRVRGAELRYAVLSANFLSATRSSNRPGRFARSLIFASLLTIRPRAAQPTRAFITALLVIVVAFFVSHGHGRRADVCRKVAARRGGRPIVIWRGARGCTTRPPASSSHSTWRRGVASGCGCRSTSASACGSASRSLKRRRSLRAHAPAEQRCNAVGGSEPVQHLRSGHMYGTRSRADAWLAMLKLRSDVFESCRARFAAASRARGGPLSRRGELGRGGMGAVYRVARRAQRPQARAQAAAHGARREHARGADAALFEREYHTLCQLAHPRIIEVYDYGVDDGGAVLHDGAARRRDLRERGQLPWREACALLRDVASSLAILHSRGCCTATSRRATCAAPATGAPS